MLDFERSVPWSNAVGFAVRDAIRGELRDRVTGEVLRDVELVATELATNAYSHGRPLANDQISFRIEFDDGVIRVVVIDGGEAFVPEWETSAGPATGGLRVVDRIAVAWGVSGDAMVAVWADVARVPDATS